MVEGVAAFRALDGKVPEIRSWELGWNVSDRPDAYDFALNSSFDDPEALRRYVQHPEHQAGAALWRAFATWVVADYAF
ncbi:Dabb family protein [Streptomyces cinereospinus]